MNRAYAVAEGHDPSYYVGKSHFDIFPNPENERIFRRAVETGQPHSVRAQRFEYPGRPERGVSYWDWTLQPILDREGSVTELVLSVQDATDWILSQEATREAEASFRQLAENVSDGFWIAELSSGEGPGKVLYANPAFAEIFGLTEETSKDYNAWFQRVHPRDRARVLQRMREFRSGQAERYSVELRVVHLDRSTHWLWVKAHRVSTGQGRLERVVVLIRDITERKADERRLRGVRRRLARRVRELRTVHEAGRQLATLHTPETLAQAVIDTLEATLSHEHGAVLVTDAATGDLLPFALSNPGGSPEALSANRAYVASHRPHLGQGITGWVAQTGQSVRLGDVWPDPRYHAVREGIRSELCVPLRFGDRILGVLNVETAQPNAYSAADRRVLETVAAQIAVAIENARLYERELPAIADSGRTRGRAHGRALRGRPPP